jgi:thioesterase domain-containing protein/uncharacterized protein YbdZ (MbtH family)/acyl carrier protein
VQSSISFDLTITSLFAPLLAGGAVWLLPESRGVEMLRDAFRSPVDFSLVKLTPAHLELLGRQLSPEEAPGRTRAFIIGGENLTARHVAFWEQFAPATVLVNEYGPTETVVGCCVYQVPPGKHTHGSIPIGRPIANTRLYVLDAAMIPVAPGIPGELYIGGPGLARGYLNRPDLTAKQFVPDPFSGEPGARLYRAGDLVRSLPDGNLEFLGRIDRQVKIRDFRIEPAEIEVVLCQHPAVRNAVVVARQDGQGNKRLVVYVVLAKGQSLTLGGVRRFLKEKLPDYMVPSALVIVDHLPLTVNGKVDHRALPAPAAPTAERSHPCVSPRDPLEARLVLIWEKVLGVRPIGVHDNFFDLGGDSLQAAHLFVQLQQVFGQNLSPADLMQAPTVEGLAKVLAQPAPEKWSSLVPIQPRGSRPPLFCIHGIGGEVFGFGALARCLGEDQPFYGLRARPPQEAKAYTPLEEIAAQYLQEVRALQPEGPYYLGGYSLGGTVAFEMAQQLLAQGQHIGLLAVVDQGVFPNGRLRHFRRPRCLVEFFRNIPCWIQYDLLKSGPVAMLNRARFKARSVLKTIARRVRGANQEARKAEAESWFDPGRLPAPVLNVIHTLYQAIMAYKPRPYPGRITLLRARAQALFRLQDRELNWGELARGGVQNIIVPGTHADLLQEPRVQMLAARLKACLAQTQAWWARGDGSTRLAYGTLSAESPESVVPYKEMRNGASREELVYKVVVNDQDQYSLWPASRAIPPGWKDLRKEGTQEECLAFIQETWRDMRPLRLRLLVDEVLSPSHLRKSKE